MIVYKRLVVCVGGAGGQEVENWREPLRKRKYRNSDNGVTFHFVYSGSQSHPKSPQTSPKKMAGNLPWVCQFYITFALATIAAQSIPKYDLHMERN